MTDRDINRSTGGQDAALPMPLRLPKAFFVSVVLEMVLLFGIVIGRPFAVRPDGRTDIPTLITEIVACVGVFMIYKVVVVMRAMRAVQRIPAAPPRGPITRL